MHLPSEIATAVREAGVRLGRALDMLEWPNGERDAPPHEINALINFQGRLSNLDPPYLFYSEGSIAQRGRVDLIASNGDISLAIEAKSFGRINERSISIGKDLQRLRRFKPAYYQGETPRQITDWWADSKQRWGLLLITSFRGDAVRNAWVSECEDEARDHMETYRLAADRPTDNGTGFMALRATPGLYRFAVPITLSDRWADEGRGHILCGAVELASVPEDEVLASSNRSATPCATPNRTEIDQAPTIDSTGSLTNE